MRSKFIVLVIGMTLLSIFISSFSKRDMNKQQPISRTGNIAAAIETLPRAAIATAVPTVVARPVAQAQAPAYPQPVVNHETASNNLSNPAMSRFISSVVNGNAKEVVGVYVSGVMALPVRHQPSDSPNFVSTEKDVVTQFAAAERFNNIGLLAHNYLAGTYFSNLKQSQVVVVVYGNGDLKYYRIDKVERYQALTPSSPQSDFVDLNDGKNSRMTAGDVFQRIYTQNDRVIFQTCILSNGDPSWGRLFITASPIENNQSTYIAPSRSRLWTWF